MLVAVSNRLRVEEEEMEQSCEISGPVKTTLAVVSMYLTPTVSTQL
jgi:hypothetical protein